MHFFASLKANAHERLQKHEENVFHKRVCELNFAAGTNGMGDQVLKIVVPYTAHFGKKKSKTKTHSSTFLLLWLSLSLHRNHHTAKKINKKFERDLLQSHN